MRISELLKSAYPLSAVRFNLRAAAKHPGINVTHFEFLTSTS